jgi:serine/threonine protein kinase
VNSHDPDESRLIELASFIDDDQPIDWDSAEPSTQDALERAVVSEMRVVAGLTQALRRPDEHMTRGSKDEAHEPSPPATPRAWGPLVILEPIGSGAFGTVYRARDSLGREVALKLFKPRPEQDSAKRARVLQEARLLASISHANIVDVYGADRFDGRLGLWMELIRGRTLDEELRTRGMFSAQEAKLIGLDLCRALAAVHDAGLVHRDVKARNVMREGGGRIVLMDFGTGVLAESGLTDVAGTPLYLAPEIFDRQVATRASDVYSLGVLLYHLVSGAYPVSGTDRIEIQRGHAEGRRTRLRDIRPDLPAGFVHAVESALAPDPQRRYQTAGEFEHALMSEGVVPPPRPIPRRLPVRPWLAIAALAIVAISASIVGASWMLRSPTAPGGTADASTTSASAGSSSVAPAAVPADTYTVSAALYKFSRSKAVRLAAGDRVAPGDTLALRIQSSRPVYVYVVNEDEHGESYLLFPLQGQESGNPLAPERPHELPGQQGGQDTQWQVTSAGGREHFVVFASPSQMSIFDELLSSLPRPIAGRPVSRPLVPQSLVGRLRGVGGLLPGTQSSMPANARVLFGMANPLGTEPETVRGLWVRQVWLRNPGK